MLKPRTAPRREKMKAILKAPGIDTTLIAGFSESGVFSARMHSYRIMSRTSPARGELAVGLHVAGLAKSLIFEYTDIFHGHMRSTATITTMKWAVVVMIAMVAVAVR